MSDIAGPFRAALTLGEGVVVERVHAVRGYEEVSHPFRYEVDFSASEVDLDSARGAEAHVLLEDTLGQTRNIRGIVQSLTVHAVPEGLMRLRAVLVPGQCLLTLRRGFRIFQDKSTPEIIKTVF